MLDDAPVRFSVTNCWPRICPILAPTTRAVMSAVEPAAKPLMICTGAVGKSCAGAGAAAKTNAAAVAAMSGFFKCSSLALQQGDHDLARLASRAVHAATNLTSRRCRLQKREPRDETSAKVPRAFPGPADRHQEPLHQRQSREAPLPRGRRRRANRPAPRLRPEQPYVAAVDGAACRDQ